MTRFSSHFLDFCQISVKVVTVISLRYITLKLSDMEERKNIFIFSPFPKVREQELVIVFFSIPIKTEEEHTAMETLLICQDKIVSIFWPKYQIILQIFGRSLCRRLIRNNGRKQSSKCDIFHTNFL